MNPYDDEFREIESNRDYECELERAREEAWAWGDSFDEDDFSERYHSRNDDWE